MRKSKSTLACIFKCKKETAANYFCSYATVSFFVLGGFLFLLT